jgi:tetratricopeptide (TPR) repeat protein
MRRALWPLLLAACATPTPPPPEEPRPSSATTRADPVIATAEASLAKGDVAGAREDLERGRWLADDRARAALLLYGCLLLEGRMPDAVAALREYLEKTTKLVNPRDRTAIRLLRHHASGGGLEPKGAEEACYFGLYALKALREPDSALPDLERALREAPEPERLLAKIALEP